MRAPIARGDRLRRNAGIHPTEPGKGEIKMHKKLTALALLMAAACLGTSAQAKDLTGWFINGGVGSAHYKASYEGVSGTESDTGFQINGGWRSQFIGFEGGYVDLGSISENDGLGDSAKLSGKGWTLGLNGHFNPTDKWYISARAGFFFWNVDLRAKLADGTGASDSENGMNGYAGIGTGIDFNRNWSAGVNFDYYKINKDHFEVGTKVYTVNVEYRF
jgi:opacity protein-like surface antigen